MKIILKSADFTEYHLEQITYIGSDEACKISLKSASVSEHHARIEKKEGHFFIRDNRSVTGVLVNRERIKDQTEIFPGDVIHIGEFEMYVCEPDEKHFPVSSKNFKWKQELAKLASASRTEFPILLLGPSGAGKEVLASAIHKTSSRRNGPYISVNCGAMAESLIESELFGHTKGSFTGAITDRKGAFESARGGTLFLDEIGDLPLALQAKLLRALENKEIRPVGSDKTISTDVRIISATNQNLQDRMLTKEFREDLYYRLNVIELKLPSLTDRIEDFEDILNSFAKEMRVRFTFPAIMQLKTYAWKGNYRELKNIVARASALYGREEITLDVVKEMMSTNAKSAEAQSELLAAASGNLPIIKELERQMIMQRLSINKGNQRRTAADLGLPKSTLHDRLKTYGIDVNTYKLC